MRWTNAILVPLGLACVALAQSRTSPSPNVVLATSTSSGPALSSNTTTTTTNTDHTLLTTTLTSLLPGATGTQTTTYVLTLALNGTELQYQNGTAVNASALNATSHNSTAIAWNATSGWLPFKVVIDPAYGTLGGLLILTGIPVAVLGGKNRWSSLATVSGYSLMLFTIVMILHFGVEPNLQPPSPSPPSTTLRGLYLLACIIAAFFGAALGIFFFTFSKYFVSAAGGFTFGWFLLAIHRGGLVDSVLGRGGMLGSLTVLAFIASLPKLLEPHMMLVSTAWIGAMAFTLGVDCYTRAGLKEFFIYNLGFHDLFPSLGGMGYPLTQTMVIELGILVGMVLIGAAIQFRLLNILQKRLKMMREEDEARVEADEVAKAAERFKNVGDELSEWESKHGKDSAGGSTQMSTLNGDAMSIAMPTLGFYDAPERRPSSSLSLLSAYDGQMRYDSLPVHSPPASYPATPTGGRLSLMEELNSPGDERRSPATALSVDPELESQLKLLEEVRKARDEVRGSLDKLRASTPAPSIASKIDASRTTTPTPTLGAMSDDNRRRVSSVSTSRILEYVEKPRPTSQSEWDQYVQERKLLTPTSITSPTFPNSAAVAPAASRHSQYALVSDWDRRSAERRERTTSMLDPRKSISNFSPDILQSPISTYPQPDGPPDRMASFYGPPMTFHDMPSQSHIGPPVIIGSARPAGPVPALRPLPQRTMTYDELAERHRKRLSKLQEPVTAKMREEVIKGEAQVRTERQKRSEVEGMRRTEQDREARAREGEVEQLRPATGREEVVRSTEDWRRSVHTGAGAFDSQLGLDRDRRTSVPLNKRMSTQSFAN